MNHKDLLGAVFLEIENGHDMLNFSEISRRCYQIFHRHIKIIHTQVHAPFVIKYSYMINHQVQRHGINRWWYSNEKLMYETNWYRNQYHGIRRGWYSDGRFEYEDNYHYGKKIEK